MKEKLNFDTKKVFSAEEIRRNVSEKIRVARENPIFESRLAELEARLNYLDEQFIRTKYRESDQIVEENLIEAEILKSSALAGDITEFREMLDQIASEYGKPKEWVLELLAHENAHANVAGETDHDWVGYATIFIKDESGELSSIQPLHFTKPKLSWGPQELISKRIDVLEAPERYGNKASEYDARDIVKERERLEEVRMRDQKEQAEIAKIRQELNIP